MRALDRKLLRDLRRMWAQALAIALVMAAGVATIVLALGSYRSLEETRAAYYERYRFGDVFARVTRAPEGLLETIREMPEVQAAEARIIRFALIDVAGMSEPATGLVQSLPDRHPPELDRLYLRVGRLPQPESAREIAINEAFAKAHGFRPGDMLQAIMNGRKRALQIVGIVLSPAHIYAVGPGDLMPDDRRFVAFWMSHKALAAIWDLDGAFNDLAVKLVPGASEPDIIGRLDALLVRYGGVGAYGRKDHASHAFLDAELQQLAAMGRVIPPIFLLVSAFLVNMTLSRLIALEREQIGLLKAIGYGRAEVAWHYVKLALAISVVGILIGAVAGTWLGQGLTRLYGDFFHFPFHVFTLEPDLYLISGAVTALAAVVGGAKAIYGALSLSPAVAMQPPAPPRYARVLPRWVPSLRVASMLGVMAFRHMARWPVRAALTTLGIAFSVAILVTAFFTLDSVEEMIDVAFFKTDRQHASLAFAERKPVRIVQEVQRMPGVARVEPYRAVSARLRNGNRERKVSILGKPAERDLSRVLNQKLQPVALPRQGLVISERLAHVLGLARGDHVDVEVLEGRRTHARAVVADVITSYFGLAVYMDLTALNELIDEGPNINGVHLAYDVAQENLLFAAVKRTPVISSMTLQKRSLVKFRETLAQNINIMTAVYAALSCIIAFGVVYNSARIQLSERARELASLRVLGFTRAEVSRVLLTELALLTCLALPLGWLIGYGFAWATVLGFANDLYSVPFVIAPPTYAKAALIVIIAASVSALIVRRRIDRFDLVAVLKARD